MAASPSTRRLAVEKRLSMASLLRTISLVSVPHQPGMVLSVFLHGQAIRQGHHRTQEQQAEDTEDYRESYTGTPA